MFRGLLDETVHSVYEHGEGIEILENLTYLISVFRTKSKMSRANDKTILNKNIRNMMLPFTGHFQPGTTFGE